MSKIDFLKHSISAVAVGTFIFFAAASGESKPDPEQEKSNEKILEVVNAEPKVKDAVITDANVLYVGVIDDGTKRDGYAEYLCQVLKDNQSDISRVKVVRFNSHNDPDKDNAYGVQLGEAWCK